MLPISGILKLPVTSPAMKCIWKTSCLFFHDEIPEHAQHPRPAGNVLWAQQLRWGASQSFTNAWPETGLLQKDQLMKAVWIDQREKGSDGLSSNTRCCGAWSGHLREEDGTKSCTENLPWQPHLLHIRRALHLHTLCYTSVIVLAHASKWLIFIQHFQLKYLSVDRIQNQKRTNS